MKSELRKQQILDCAKQIFSAKGYYDTQIEDIIRLASIGKGTIYKFFKNKEDIFLSLIERFVNEWEIEVTDSLKEVRKNKKFYNHPALNDLYGIVIITLKFFQKDSERGAIIHRRGPGLNIEIETYMTRFESRILSLIVEALEAGQKFGNINKGVNTAVMSNFLFGGVMRTAYQFLVLEKNEDIEADLHPLARDLVYTMSSGIFNFSYFSRD